MVAVDCQSGVWVAPGGDNALKASNGYTILPSGVIFQWGAIAVPTNGSSGISAFVGVTRPISCPTDAGHVQATMDATGFGTVGGSYSTYVGYVTASSFAIAVDEHSTSARTVPVRWQSVCW